MNYSFFRKMKILKTILKKTGAGKMLLSFVCFIFFDALIIYIFDPAISTYRDAVWYCYGVISTTGFGDVVVSTPVGRACSVILTLYSTLVIAIVTGVIVSFYTELIKDKRMELEDEIRKDE